jgi:hypothetical protein
MITSNVRFSQIQAPIKAVHSNLDQEIIQITEDKLRLALNEHLALCEQKRGWIAPLGLVVTIIIVFTTSTFKDAWFKAPTWEAAFFITGILCAAWLVVASIGAWKSPSVEDIVEKVKNKSAVM